MAPQVILKRLLDCSEEVAWVKRLILCEECISYPRSGFRNDLSFSRVFTACFFHLDFLWQQGHLLNLSDQFRKKFHYIDPLRVVVSHLGNFFGYFVPGVHSQELT